MIRLYNTLSRKKEELKPIHKEWVGLYTCGPTVYNYAHIGNLRTYISEDVLQRTLEYNGYAVRRVMNITDVGHLTGDGDTGDDKLDKEARAEKKSVEEIAEFYTKAFFDDLAKLNIKKPDIIAPATKFVNQQIALIETLFEQGLAYNTPAAVYFEVSKFKNYGALSGQSFEDKMTGARGEVVVDKEKHNPADFALWFKLVGKFKKHLLRWPSPWGEGFPGWHIECSAISRHFLGQPFDIHTGGVDHIGTHHTNEIAQSEGAYGIPLAKIWMHGEYLTLNESKMAKSEGNFLTLSQLEKKGYYPLAFRYFVLSAHYRTRLNFALQYLKAAEGGLQGLYEAIFGLAHEKHEKKVPPAPHGAETKKYENEFLEAINDDLNTSRALAMVREVAETKNLSSAEKLELIKQFDQVLGLDLETPANFKPPSEVSKIVSEYDRLRENKQFIQSDGLRKELKSLGYTVKDTLSGSLVSPSSLFSWLQKNHS